MAQICMQGKWVKSTETMSRLCNDLACMSPTTHNTTNILLCLGMHHVLSNGYIQHNQYKLTLWLGASPQTPISVCNS